MTTKPCALCDKPLEPVFFGDWTTYQPANGGEVQLIFTYGSRNDLEHYRGLICDDCGDKLKMKMDAQHDVVCE